MAEATAIILGVAFLYVFYRAVETTWPTGYYSVGRKTDQTISHNFVAYLLFRFGPIYITCVFAGAVLSREGHAVVLPVLLIAVIHAVITSGRVLLALARSRDIRRRPLVASLHTVIIVLASAVGVVGGFTASAFEDYVPSGDELTTALWTALLAGVVGAFLVRAIAASEPDTHSALGRSRQSIPDSLWLAAETAAIAVKAEPRLVHAFMLVENIQRPRWPQAMERFAGRVVGRGSYGPLQVTAGSALRDQDALTKAITERFAGRSVPHQSYEWGEQTDRQWLKFFALSYNPDPAYAEDIQAAYMWIEYPSSQAIASTEARGADNLPQVEVHEFYRDDGGVKLAGTAASLNGEVNLRLVDGAGVETHSEAIRLVGDPGQYRRRWNATVTVPPASVNVELWSGDATTRTAESTILLPA